MSLKILIEVVSWKGDRPKQYAARTTWMREYGHLVDAKFLLGEGNLDDWDDEWIFLVDDSWDGKSQKIAAAHARALALGYDYIFHISLDCYPVIPRLLARSHLLNGRQYVGTKSGGGPYLGEAGMWFGRQAMEVIANAKQSHNSYDDQWIGEKLAAAGIQYDSEPYYAAGNQQTSRFEYEREDIWLQSQNASVHLGRGSGSFQPQWMIDCHQSWMERGDHHYFGLGL